jgi:hypothetical protein
VLTAHCSINGTPASAVLGLALLVSITSSVLGVQVPLLMVQRRVALVPTGTAVTPLISEPGVVTVAVPPITLHVPLPVTAALPARVKFALLHWGISAPALAIVGVAWLVSMISSGLLAQLPLLTVQRKVALVPAVTPVMVLVRSEGFVITGVEVPPT